MRSSRLLGVAVALCAIGLMLTAAAIYPLFTPTVSAQANRAPVRLAAPYRVTIGVTAAQLTSSGNVNGGVVLKAICPGQTIYVGTADTVTTATGYPMSDGETLTLEVQNASAVYAIASAAAQQLSVLPFSRY